MLHRLGEIAPEHLERVFEGRLQTPDDHGCDREHDELGADLDEAQRSEHRILALYDEIYRGSDQGRRSQIEQSIEHRADGGNDDPLSMRRGVRPQATQRMCHELKCPRRSST